MAPTSHFLSHNMYKILFYTKMIIITYLVSLFLSLHWPFQGQQPPISMVTLFIFHINVGLYYFQSKCSVALFHIEKFTISIKMFKCTIIHANVGCNQFLDILFYILLLRFTILHPKDHMNYFTEHCSDSPFYIQTLHSSVLMHHFTSKCLETQFYITLFECTLLYPNVQMHNFAS